MTDRSHPTPQLEAVRSIVAELDQARTPDPARISTAFRELQEAKRDYSHPATIARLEMRLREARNAPRASREAIKEIEARLAAAYREWSATKPKGETRRPPQRTARNHRPTPKATPLTAKEAAERTRQLEAKAKARASSSPAKSANVEAINAARIEAILAAIERMATPDTARIAQALRTERPAVRRAVTKHLQRKQAA